MKKTPLHKHHIELGARMGEFGGWDMPIQYAGILHEHLQTRTKASIFDICHMGEFELSGPNVLADLENLLTCNVASLDIGQVRYGFMLNNKGGTLDDLTCYRLGADRYMLVVNAGTLAGDAEWIKSRISPDTAFSDLSDETAKLDVQGPKSREIMEETFGCKLPDLGFFRAEEIELDGVACLLSRTGYTGEWGYEIYLPNESSAPLWNKLLEHELLEPCGLGARDTLRLEMGYPLYGHELCDTRTPAATTRGMFISKKKEFTGYAAVQADLENPKQLLVALQFESKRAARRHDKVFRNDAEIGEVTSGSLAPSLGVAVAMAFVDARFAKEGQSLQVGIRGKPFPAKVVTLPFYKNGTARG
jgi:aminomethyltransferase